MALVRCPDCKNIVSAQAPGCPKCGRPIRKKPPASKPMVGRQRVLFAVVGLVFLIVGGIVGKSFNSERVDVQVTSQCKRFHITTHEGAINHAELDNVIWLSAGAGVAYTLGKATTLDMENLKKRGLEQLPDGMRKGVLADGSRSQAVWSEAWGFARRLDAGDDSR